MSVQNNLFGAPEKPRKSKRHLVHQAAQLDDRSADGSVKEFARFKMASGRSIVLFHGDCFVGMERLLDAKSVDVVVTSPPYNIGVRYGTYDDRIPREAYLKWIREWGMLVKRVLKPDGSLFLNIGSKPSDPWIPFDVAEEENPAAACF